MIEQGAKGSVLNKVWGHKNCFAPLGNRIPGFCMLSPARHLDTLILFLRQDDDTLSFTHHPTFCKLHSASLPQAAGNTGCDQNITEISKNLLIQLDFGARLWSNMRTLGVEGT